ncbi:ADP-ribosylglycohydrolase family protein [Candidatus Uhrbacteria bacterium]|nr:ADP-ribosylglycohydrolase family protein [Candidatus Uhrbacteria bacterium]
MAQSSHELLRAKYRGCLVGLAIGDALGMPVESMTAGEILEKTGGRGVDQFLAPIQTRFHSVTHLRPGQWTDDTQLTLATARSLVRCRTFNLEDIAAEHIKEHGCERRGWGQSTEIGIRELRDGVRKPGEPVRDPKAAGMGNGVAMKIAAHALYMGPMDLTSSDTRGMRGAQEVQQIASLTHRDDCAAIAAHAIELMIGIALAENSFASMRAAFACVPDMLASCPVHGSVLRDRCRSALEGTPEEQEELLGRADCDVRESIPFVLTVLARAFMVHATRVGRSSPGEVASDLFRDGMLTAVNAGGDTDSSGAMIGAMLGAMLGINVIPMEWRNGVESSSDIIALADELFAVAMPREE